METQSGSNSGDPGYFQLDRYGFFADDGADMYVFLDQFSIFISILLQFNFQTR